MPKQLGEIHWAALVKYAETEHKEAFFRAFTPASGVLCCEGSIEGTPCPQAVCINLTSLSVVLESGTELPGLQMDLPGLHMDGAHDIEHVCKI